MRSFQFVILVAAAHSVAAMPLRTSFLSMTEQFKAGFGENPISKVATLLESLATEIEDDKKAEQDLFDKYTCWYKAVMSAKKASNSEANDKIEALTAYIDDIKSGRIEFSSEGADATKDVEELNTELEKSAAMREKENTDFEAAKDEMETTIGALEKALEELEAGTEGSLLSTQKVVKLGHSMLSGADAQLLEKGLTGKGQLRQPDYKKMNKKREFNKKYAKASGKIQELIADMLQTFKDNLDEAKEKEKDAKAQYEKLKSAKDEQLDNAKQTLSSLGGETASREEAVAEAEGEVDDLEEQIKKDKDFVKEITEAYEEKLGEWKERKKLMTEEISAISKAMSILTSDEARDSMSTTFDKDKVFAFTQITAKSTNSRVVRMKKAVLALRIHARSVRLHKLAAKLDKEDDGRFDKVIEILNDVKKDLTKESKDDKEKKDECDEKLQEKTTDAQESANFIDDKSRLINRTKVEVTELYGKVNKTVEEVEELEWDLNDATIQREDTNLAYQKEKAGLEAAIGFIKAAKKALEKFYDDNGLSLAQTHTSKVLKAPDFDARDMVVEGGKAPPPPPPIVTKEYKGHGGSKNIQGMLEDIKDDVQKDLDELNDNEKNSKKDFEDTKKEIEDSVEEKMNYKSDLEEQIAGKLDDISTANQEKLGEKDTLDATIQALKAIEPSCNYVFTTFETRIKNREVEAEGVNDAIDALGGDPSEVEHKEASKA